MKKGNLLGREIENFRLTVSFKISVPLVSVVKNA